MIRKFKIAHEKRSIMFIFKYLKWISNKTIIASDSIIDEADLA
jgi:hypothetical protein